jgi:Xaa-Pro aminopeptidase
VASGGWSPERELDLAVARRFPELPVRDARPVMAELRMIKSPREVEVLRRVVAITAAAMLEVAATVRPGVTERTLLGRFEAACRSRGAQRFPFTPIIKSGPNALWPWRILASHYDRRDRALAAGDVVVFDVGCELDGYVSDIGRTFPVGGVFRPEQRQALDMVTAVSDAIVAAIRPGVTLVYLLRVAEAAIPAGERTYMRTPSFFGHHIGMASGDPSLLEAPLAPGMVFTVEPWYYNHDRGIAVFVEDDVLVTPNGVEVLSRRLPRSADSLTAAVRR